MTLLLDYSIKEIKNLIEENKKDKICFAGEGSIKYREMILELKDDSIFASEENCIVRASSIAKIGYKKYMKNGCKNELFVIEPFYLAKSQAERQKGVN